MKICTFQKMRMLERNTLMCTNIYRALPGNFCVFPAAHRSFSGLGLCTIKHDSALVKLLAFIDVPLWILSYKDSDEVPWLIHDSTRCFVDVCQYAPARIKTSAIALSYRSFEISFVTLFDCSIRRTKPCFHFFILSAQLLDVFIFHHLSTSLCHLYTLLYNYKYFFYFVSGK